MKSKVLVPAREEADKLLEWAEKQNPGPWTGHCRTAGRTAEAIARKCGLDAGRAYVSGLLHDIGYYSYRSGEGEKDHIFAGYDLMMEKGHGDAAKICLSHSFPCSNVKEFASSWIKCDENEMEFLSSFLGGSIYDDYDKLIQLCDALCWPQGVVILEKRLVEVAMRKGFGEFTLQKWGKWFSLKDYFDELCGANIYSLFHDEINASIFT
jgi:hypothetical protein